MKTCDGEAWVRRSPSCSLLTSGLRRGPCHAARCIRTAADADHLHAAIFATCGLNHRDLHAVGGFGAPLSCSPHRPQRACDHANRGQHTQRKRQRARHRPRHPHRVEGAGHVAAHKGLGALGPGGVWEGLGRVENQPAGCQPGDGDSQLVLQFKAREAGGRAGGRAGRQAGRQAGAPSPPAPARTHHVERPDAVLANQQQRDVAHCKRGKAAAEALVGRALAVRRRHVTQPSRVRSASLPAPSCPLLLPLDSSQHPDPCMSNPSLGWGALKSLASSVSGTRHRCHTHTQPTTHPQAPLPCLPNPRHAAPPTVAQHRFQRVAGLHHRRRHRIQVEVDQRDGGQVDAAQRVAERGQQVGGVLRPEGRWQ